MARAWVVAVAAASVCACGARSALVGTGGDAAAGGDGATALDAAAEPAAWVGDYDGMCGGEVLADPDDSGAIVDPINPCGERIVALDGGLVGEQALTGYVLGETLLDDGGLAGPCVFPAHLVGDHAEFVPGARCYYGRVIPTVETMVGGTMTVTGRTLRHDYISRSTYYRVHDAGIFAELTSASTFVGARR